MVCSLPTPALAYVNNSDFELVVRVRDEEFTILSNKTHESAKAFTEDT